MNDVAPLFDTRLLENAHFDATAAILRVHLVAEQALLELLRQRATDPSHIDTARLSFSALLKVCAAFVRVDPSKAWLWMALEQLNRVRNAVAHNLQPDGHRFDDRTMLTLKQLFETISPHLPDFRWPNGERFFTWDADSALNAIGPIAKALGDALNGLDLRAAPPNVR